MDQQPAEDDAVVIVALPAVIDATSVDVVYERLAAAVASGAPVIIADLSATAMCDSAGVRRLLMIRHLAAERGSQLRLVIPPRAVVRRVQVLLGVDHLLPVYSSIDSACRPPVGPHDPLPDCPAAPA